MLILMLKEVVEEKNNVIFEGTTWRSWRNFDDKVKDVKG